MKDITSVIAIDCGSNGGIAVYKDGKETAVKMPKTNEDFKEYIEYWKSISKPIVFIEKLSVRPDDVVADGTGVNMGKLFRIQKMIANFEQLKTIVECAGVPYVLVHPMKWQNGLKLRIKGEEKQARKNRYKDVAQSYYPTIKATLWNADALLILRFARMVLINDEKYVRENIQGKAKEKLF